MMELPVGPGMIMELPADPVTIGGATLAGKSMEKSIGFDWIIYISQFLAASKYIKLQVWL